MLLLLVVVALVFWFFWFHSLLAAFYTVFGQKCLPKMLFLWLPLARLPLLLLLLLLTNQTLQALLPFFSFGLVFFGCSLLSHITGTIHRQKRQQQQQLWRQLTSQLSSAVCAPFSSICTLFWTLLSWLLYPSSPPPSLPFSHPSSVVWEGFFSITMIVLPSPPSSSLPPTYISVCLCVCVCVVSLPARSAALFLSSSFSSPNDDRLFADCCFFLFGGSGCWLPLMTNRYCCCSFSFFFSGCVWFSEACIIDRQRAGEGSAKSISPTLGPPPLSLCHFLQFRTLQLLHSASLSVCLSVWFVCFPFFPSSSPSTTALLLLPFGSLFERIQQQQQHCLTAVGRTAGPAANPYFAILSFSFSFIRRTEPFIIAPTAAASSALDVLLTLLQCISSHCHTLACSLYHANFSSISLPFLSLHAHTTQHSTSTLIFKSLHDNLKFLSACLGFSRRRRGTSSRWVWVGEKAFWTFFFFLLFFLLLLTTWWPRFYHHHCCSFCQCLSVCEGIFFC